MTERGKWEYEREKAKEIMARWKTATISELSWAVKRYDGAILLLIARLGEG
jgi:hypothetical protein